MAVGLKTLLEAAQYIEEQEQQQKSPLSANHHHHYLHHNHQQHHLNSSNLINESNNNNAASCFIAHYSLAVSAPKASLTSGITTGTTSAAAITNNSLTNGSVTTLGTTKIDENNKISLSPVEGFLSNVQPQQQQQQPHHHILHSHNQQHHVVATDIDSNMLNTKKALFSTAITCQPIMQNMNINGITKKHQIAASAPASTTLTQHVAALGNGFSLTAKTKTPAEFLLTDKDNINESNNNNNNNNNNINKGQLLTGTIIPQHVNPNNQHHLPTSVNAVNVAATNVAAPYINKNNSNHNGSSSSSSGSTNSINNNNLNNNITNNGNDDFDKNNISLSPVGNTKTGRVRSASASASNNVFVLGIVDPSKTTNTSNQTNLLQTNVHNATDSKGLQMMIVNEATGTNNLTPCNWMINNESPQRNNGNILNCMESPSPTSIGGHMEILTGKNITGGLGSQTHTIPSIGSNVRRRTISSTSNGAGTREVHNKLEKNRRAHLKECYERLKNQLNLKDEDRKKTSNLAVLGEALNQVMALQKQDQELEAKIEQLAKDKINSQKRIVSLKRELGPRYEQIFSGIFPENEITMTSIPNERDNFNNSTPLASGRGSALYSSSNSLSSSGGSTCSNNTTLSSSIGTTATATTHLHTNSSTTIIPVIPKHNTAVKITAATGNNCLGGIAASLLSFNNNNNNNTTIAGVAATTKSTSLINVKNNDIFLQNINNNKNNNTNSNNNNINKPFINQQQGTIVGNKTTNILNNNILTQQCPASPSTSAAVVGVNNLMISTTAGLSLTAKNISETSLTRGSPTPSTPSPSPSSSSGVSSSSSFISSSPPITNGVGNNGNAINANSTTRQVCINVPNGMKFHVANGDIFQGTIASGETAIVASTLKTGTLLRNNNNNN